MKKRKPRHVHTAPCLSTQSTTKPLSHAHKEMNTDAIISAIIGDFINRVTSFLIKKYIEKTDIDGKLERLQQLLLRIHAVVEEADARYITNPRMLMQLKLLVESMYRGYHTLDIFRYKSPWERTTHEEVRSSSSARLTSSNSLKRSRTIAGITSESSHDLLSVLENLETAVTNMKEFVLLLGGCDRCRRPYDTYLYMDNFMFGRHVEKQHISNILLQGPGRLGAPLVLPIIGGCRVGKKTLVSHVCKNDRIQSYFSCILFINGDNIQTMNHENLRNCRTLVVINFVSDVDDEDWVKFYSTIACMTAEGSKVIIISRIQDLARFGTVKAVFLNSLPHEEYRYLFKTLAFGSTDEKDYPHLASVANELAVVLGGSFVTANVVADALRSKQDFQFWHRILQRFKGMVDYNLSIYGEHPKEMLDNERPIDITTLMSSRSYSLRLMPPRVDRGDYCPETTLAHMLLGDLVTGCITAPSHQFVVAWESRIPPYTKLVLEVACAEEKRECSTCARKRRSII